MNGGLGEAIQRLACGPSFLIARPRSRLSCGLFCVAFGLIVADPKEVLRRPEDDHPIRDRGDREAGITQGILGDELVLLPGADHEDIAIFACQVEVTICGNG